MPGGDGMVGDPGPPGPAGSLFVIPLNLGVGSSNFARAATFRDLLQKHLVRCHFCVSENRTECQRTVYFV